MNYATIKNCDIANGPGVRVSLFVSGCRHKCPGCFNEIAWDFQYGEEFTQDTIDLILDMLKPTHIKGLTLLGGTLRAGKSACNCRTAQTDKIAISGEVNLGILGISV